MQRFEFSEGTSNKFWEVAVAGARLTTRWGKIGGSINQRVADLASPEAAIKERDKLVREKTGKGYVAVGSTKKKVIAAKTAAKPAASAIKPSELALTSVRDSSGYTRLGRVVVDGQRVLATGDRALASTDGKTFHPRTSPGQVFAMAVFDGVYYALGGSPLMMSRDLGETWKDIKVPAPGYCFAIARDSKGTYWMGCDDGLVLTSQKPDGGWKKAAYKGFGKMLHVTEIDGKLFWAGRDPGVWNGKKYTRLKGVNKTDIVTRIIETPGGALVAVGDNAIVYRSTNRGESWKKVKVPLKNDEDLEDCAIVAGALIVVGGAGAILKSTNDGQSFTKIASPAYGKLWGIGSWGDGAFICGDRSVLLKLASPKDTYWKGAKDELAPKPAEVDKNFVPPPPTKNREETFARQHAEAVKLYKPTADKRPPDAKPDLAKLVEADAEGTTDALDVYADWLQGQGDPHGELAAIQLRQAGGKDKALAKAEKQLFKQHADALLGKFKDLADVVQLTWRGGFIESARIANSFDRDPDYGDGTEENAVDIEKLFAELLDHPSARFLRTLTVGLVSFEDNSYEGVAKTIGKRHIPSLRTLYLGDFSYEETELSWSAAGKLEPIYAALPNLTSLHVRSGSMNLGKIVHPTLEHFEVTTGGLDPKSARAIGSAVWPSLKRLSIMGGRARYGGTTTLKDLKPILAGDNLPRLELLGLRNFEITDSLIEALALSKILPQLSALDLSMGTLSDEGVRKLYRYQKAFQHLEKLDITDNYVSKDGQKLLRTMKLPVEIGKQREDDGDGARYASIGE